MAVSKITVIALVAIVACPILLGYAFNLTETTETGYKETGDTVNVTPLLENGYSGNLLYTYSKGDINKMNTSTAQRIPYYKTITSTNTSYNLGRSVYYNQSWTNATQGGLNVPYFYEEFDYNPAVTSVNIDLYVADSNGNNEYLFHSYTKVHYFLYRNTDNIFRYQLYANTNDGLVSFGNLSTTLPAGYHATKVKLTSTGNPVDQVLVAGYNATQYADLSAGFYFPSTSEDYRYYDGQRVPGLWNTIVALPSYTKEYTFTANLNSISASSYTYHLNIGPEYATGLLHDHYYHLYPMELKKTTVDGQTKWTIRNENDSSSQATELYYNPSIANNTYQFTISADNYYDESTGEYYINVHIKAAYVGEWPTLIGIANSYKDYELDYILRDDPALVSNSPFNLDDLSYSYMYMKADNDLRTPLIRVDDALFRAFEYKTITNRTYTPADMKDNPKTTINSIDQYGISLEFGGNTYVVSKNGTINIGGHDIPVKGLQLSSVPNAGGTYDNKIGNTIISTSANPSTIRFNGSWSASVSTQSMESFTYIKTEWHVGEFGWDGVDQNFLMVGLITCLGVFVALGIYARKSRSGGIIPLMIVTGCAAAVFFIML